MYNSIRRILAIEHDNHQAAWEPGQETGSDLYTTERERNQEGKGKQGDEVACFWLDGPRNTVK